MADRQGRLWRALAALSGAGLADLRGQAGGWLAHAEQFRIRHEGTAAGRHPPPLPWTKFIGPMTLILMLRAQTGKTIVMTKKAASTFNLRK